MRQTVVACLATCISCATLREGAEKHGIYVGTCINTPHLGDATYTSVAKEQFNLVTAENACKWDALEPEQGTFTWENCDSIRDFALNDVKGVFRGHNLCWGNQLPSWTSNLDAEGKRAALISHAKAVVSHYGKDAFAWDVVNEAITDDDSVSDPLKANTWYPDVPDYVDVCFHAAREAGGADLKLFYNDYSGDSTVQKKSDRIYQYVKGMIDRNVPIDGVGLQFHIGSWADNDGFYDGFKANLQRFAALGLEVHITELDIGFDSWSNEIEQKQANMYAKLLQICLDVEACTNFETWGFTDGSTWKQGKHPLPFDENYQPKAAVASMLAVLEGDSPTPSPVPTPSPSPALRTYERLTTTCQNAVAITGEMTVTSVQECESLCDATDGCIATDTNGQSCYLKSQCEGQVDSASTCNNWCAYRVVAANVAV